MITAEEFFREKIKKEIEWEGQITLSKVPLNAEQAMRWAHEYSVLKSKHHVTEALKQASEDVEVITLCQHGYGTVDKESILTAYPLENIK